MESQYALRFESGERRGEVIPISVVSASGGTFTIGRKPGNSLQVTDPSVSGKHAELDIGAGSVAIRDLDSTNGTLVGGQRIRQASLGHLDDFVLGAVEFTLLDTALPATNGAASSAPDELILEDPGELVLEAPGDALERRPVASGVTPIPAGLSETRMQPRDEALEISAADLERSRKSSKLGPILIVALAAIGGGLWWWIGQRDDGGGRGRAAAGASVAPPAGNLLVKGFSFESTDGWSVDDGLPSTFDPTGSARKSGRRGVRAEVYGGEAAIIESDAVRLSSSARAVRATAAVRGTTGAAVRVGLRFASTDGAATTTVWSDATEPGEDWSEVTLAGAAPAGMGRVSVLVRADGTGGARSEDGNSDVDPGSVDADDVSLVPANDAGLAAIQHEEWTIAPLASSGSGKARVVAVSSLDRLLISSLRVLTSESGMDLADLDLADLALEGSGGTISAKTTASGEFVMRAEAEMVAAGVATMADGGYAAHGQSFDRVGVKSLLFGADATLVRIGFSTPLDVTARPAGDDLVVRAQIAAGTTITIQVEFTLERTRAERLARQAQDKRRADDSGAALRTWTELLEEVPFDQRLVDLATSEQGELLAEGRAALRGLAAEVERARFFGLADLYREKLERVRELGARYAGSEVEAQCKSLEDAIRLELAALDADRDRYERLRLEAIEAVLRRRGAEDLATRLKGYTGEQNAGEGGGR